MTTTGTSQQHCSTIQPTKDMSIIVFFIDYKNIIISKHFCDPSSEQPCSILIRYEWIGYGLVNLAFALPMMSLPFRKHQITPMNMMY